jgi:dTDP-4-dehydrorhamnose 3,5-epimerase
MNCITTPIQGLYVLEMQPMWDERGYFSRVWCKEQFEKLGLSANFVQASHSFNKTKGTVRGMHYQVEPYGEIKLISCLQGSIVDTVIDVRPESATYKQHFSIELSANNGKALYVPQGFAHGFQTLEDNTLISYHISQFFSPAHARGIRWSDEQFGVSWPLPISVISSRDTQFSNYQDQK